MIGLFNMYSYTFIMSITPGPNNVICLTQGTKFGFKRSLPMGFTLIENLPVSLSTGSIFLICTGVWILFGKAFTSLYDRYHRPITYMMSAALV